MMSCHYRLLILALFLSLSHSINAHVNVLYPVGGESFTTGNTVVVEWQIAQQHELIDWDVYYSIDSGANWIPLAINLPPWQLTYEWEIPGVETDLGKIKVYMNNVDDDYIDYSGLFTIQPNTSPPAIDVEAEDLIIPCNVANQQAAIQTWLNNHGNAAVINYCGSLVWTHDYFSLSNDCGATGDAYVTFSVYDLCGSTQTTAYLFVQDNIAPTLISPSTSMTVETNGQGNTTQLNNWLNSKGGAAATDACGSITWTNNYTSITTTCGKAGSANVIFTATDECGNATTSAATFTITDQVKPTLLQPANNITLNVGIQSDSLLQNWLTGHGGASAHDLGGDVTWEYNFNGLSDGCGASGFATVTFIASDPCGNNVSTTATVQAIDQSPPVFEKNATDHAISCTETNTQFLLQQWLASHGEAIATDFGSDITWLDNFNGLSDNCGLTGSTTVTFTAYDACANSSSTTATFRITDLSAPVIHTVSNDTTIYCSQIDVQDLVQQWLSRHGGARAFDYCGSVNWTHDFIATIDSCQEHASYPVTFTAWDECLNSSSTSATFTMIDTTSEVTSVLNNAIAQFMLFPNPVSEMLTVQLENNGSIPVQIILFDAFGRKVWSGQSTSNRIAIPVEKYAAGVYFLSVKRNGGVGVKRVIIE